MQMLLKNDVIFGLVMDQLKEVPSVHSTAAFIMTLKWEVLFR